MSTKDVKPINFVVRKGVGNEWICKITDLGYSRRTVDDGSYVEMTARLGTRGWIAPELLNIIEPGTTNVISRIFSSMSGGSKSKNGVANTVNGIKLDFHQYCDVWSMGGVLHFIFSGGQHPYGDDVNQINNIRNSRPIKSGQTFLAKISQPRFRVDLLIAEMIQSDPVSRPDMKTVLKTIEQWEPSEEYLKKSDNYFTEFVRSNFFALFFVAFYLLIAVMYTLSIFKFVSLFKNY